MPLLVICGYPSSGKTTLAKDLVAALSRPPFTYEVDLISENDFGFSPATTPRSVVAEKALRGALITGVERSLRRDKWLVVDASHEMKSWRYQLYCHSRALPTLQVTLWVTTPSEVCFGLNQRRDPRYDEETFHQLVYRFESPNESTRWDCPLLRYDPTYETGLDVLLGQLNALIKEVRLPIPNAATAPKVITEAGYLGLLDKVTNQVLSHIHTIQSIHPSSCVTVTHKDWPCPLVLSRPWSSSEGQRHKRAFVQMNKLKPVQDERALLAAFVEYLAVVTGG